MESNCNYMEFDLRDEKEKASFEILLHDLINYGVESDWGYNDIHVRTDPEGVAILEWEQIPHSGEWGGRFAHVAENEEVLERYYLPDNSSVLISCPEDKWSVQQEWISANPDWFVNARGELKKKPAGAEININKEV